MRITLIVLGFFSLISSDLFAEELKTTEHKEFKAKTETIAVSGTDNGIKETADSLRFETTKSNRHEVLKTKFLGQRPYMDSKHD